MTMQASCACEISTICYTNIVCEGFSLVISWRLEGALSSSRELKSLNSPRIHLRFLPVVMDSISTEEAGQLESRYLHARMSLQP